MIISKVSISNFREIVHPIEIDFLSGSSNKPCSLIIAGDNGTGKSSIVDAIEFALRGNVGHKCPLLSYAVDDNARVIVHFSDGSKLPRVVNLISGEGYESDTKPHDKFSIASFVLRRSDILKFIQTPDAERQILFRDYFRGAIRRQIVDVTEVQQTTIDEMEQLLERKWKAKRTCAARIAELMGVPSDTVPSDIQQFEEFVSLKIYGGMTGTQRQEARKQGRRLLPRDIHQAIKQYRQISKEATDLKRQVKKANRVYSRVDTSELQKILRSR